MPELNVKDRCKLYENIIGSPAKNRSNPNRTVESKDRSIINGEKEIKALLKSGFIIKSDEAFLCNIYCRIDKEIRSNYNGIFKNDNFVEVQGASFQQMTIYGRNTTIKNIIMSKEKLTEINLRNHSNNYKFDRGINNDYKLSELTLKNYFSLKERKLNIDANKASPGVIIIERNGMDKKVEYTNTEMPSFFKFDYENKKNLFNQKPEMGIIKDYGGTFDGFRNSKVIIDGNKILEMESIHNWQKVKDYIRQRDFSNVNGGNNYLNKVEVHHITQLQDGGKEHINNFVALSQNTHKLVDSYRLLIDKNTSVYREINNQNLNIAENNNRLNLEESNAGKLVSEIGKLSFESKIFFNSIKLEIESNSALRLNLLIDNPDNIKMHFIDKKTGEEFRLAASKINGEIDKIVMKEALGNFISELPTSNV